MKRILAVDNEALVRTLEKKVIELESTREAIEEDSRQRHQVEDALRRSEERWRLIYETEPECVKIVSSEGLLVTMNPAGLAMIDADSLDEVRGKPLLRLVVPEHRDAFLALNQKVIAGQSDQLEFEIIGLRGTRRWLETHATPLPNADGTVSLLAVTRDITERKRAEESLRESEARYRLLADNTDDFIFLNDTLGNRLYISPSYFRVTGWTAEEVQRTDWRTRLHPDELPLIEHSRAANLAGESTLIEHRIRCKDGSWIWVELRCKPMKGPDGQVSQMLLWSRDISERKRMEQMLLENQARLQLLVKSSNIGLWDWNLLTNEVYFSTEWKRQLGYSDAEIPGRFEEWERRLHPEDRDRALAAASDFRTGRRSDYDVEFRLRHKDDSWRWIMSRADMIREPDGRPIRMMGCHVDVTDRKRAEEAVRESQVMLQLIHDSIPQGVFWKDRNSVYRGANRVSWQAMGLSSAQQVIGLTDFDVPSFAPEQAEFFVRKDREVMDSNQPQSNIVESLTLPNGETIWLETTKLPLHDAAGNVTGILGTWQDITERKRATEELTASRERLASMSRQLIAAQESERRHLSRELHDEIGQALTGIKLNLKGLQQAQAPKLQKPARDTTDVVDRTPQLRFESPSDSATLQDMIDVVDQTLQQVRNLALDLRPSMLDDLGLVAALRWSLDRQSQRAGFAAHFIVEPADCAASHDIETACFRVVQECLTNIARHAQSRQVVVKLRQQGGELELLVQDDGIGFDVAAARARAARGESLGLLGMQERVQLVGGQVDVESAPNLGTTIRARFPWDDAPLSGRDATSHGQEQSP